MFFFNLISHALKNYLGSEIFWVLEPNRSGSWIWRALCKLRPIAKAFVQCRVNSGITASFWLDNWTSLGLLIDVVGETGPGVTGVSIDAVIADVLNADGWVFEKSRSRNPIISFLRESLPLSRPIIESEEDDLYVWVTNGQSRSESFSTSDTWKALHPMVSEVFWHKEIWFSGRIPKHAFLSWVAARDRMVTRDRLIRWGLRVSADCVLCTGQEESRQHLFFDCEFSRRIWTYFVNRMSLSPPTQFEEVLRWLKKLSRDKRKVLLVRLIYQACLYLIWKERNSRIHGGSSRHSGAIMAEVKQVIRSWLDPIARLHNWSQGEESILSLWRSFF